MLFVKHPVGVWGFVLFCYVICGVLVGLWFRVVGGCVLFLRGVGGLIVVSMFMVCLCPGLRFKNGGQGLGSYWAGCVRVLLGVCISGLWWGVKSYRGEFGCVIDLGAGVGVLYPSLGIIMFLTVLGAVRVCRKPYGCYGGVGVLGGGKSLISRVLA